MASGTLLLPPLSSQRYISSLAFRADGKVLAVGSQTAVQSLERGHRAAHRPDSPASEHLCMPWRSVPMESSCSRDAGTARRGSFARPPRCPTTWIALPTGSRSSRDMTLEPRQGEIQILDNPAWLASRERLEQRGGPPVSAWDSLAATEGRPTGLAWALSQVRSDGAWEEFWLASSSLRQGRPDEAVAAYRQSLAIAERLMAKYPAEPDYRRMAASGQNNFAWLLATEPDPKVRDPAQAVELARKAVRIEPKAACLLEHARNRPLPCRRLVRGDRGIRKSNELDAKTALGFNAYFLAMAHRRRGESGAGPDLVRHRRQVASPHGPGRPGAHRAGSAPRRRACSA